MAVREIVGVLCLVSTIGLLLTLNKPKEIFDKRMTIIAVVVQLAASIGTLATGTSQGLETLVPEVKNLSTENEELKKENSEMKQNISDQSQKIAEQEFKIKTLSASMKDNAEFLDYKLYNSNREIPVNSSDAIANINEKYFYQKMLYHQ